MCVKVIAHLCTVYIYRLLAIFVVFLSTSTMHSSSVSALWVCELVPEVILRSVYMTLVLSSGRCCLTGRRCWSNPNTNQEVYIYIYILTVCTHQFLVLWWLCPEAHIKYKVSWQNSSMCRKNWRKVFWGIVHHYISRFNSFQADVAPFRKQRPSTLKKPSGMAWRMAPKKILGRVWFV